MRGWQWLVWTSTVGSLAVGCGGGSPAPVAANKVTPGAQPAAAKAAAQKPALPMVKPKIPEPGPPLPPLTYEPKGRRDPFAPVELRKDKPGLDVANLKLVGIISGRDLMALVEAPGGLGYILKPGDSLGNGHVSEISAGSVTFAVSGERSSQEARVTLRLGRD
jgi:Tfp pilus assembly protein PilP